MASPDLHSDPRPRLEVRHPDDDLGSPVEQATPTPARSGRRSPARLGAAIAALAILGGMALFLPGNDTLRGPAVVEANRTFTLTALANGRYRVSEADGSAPGGPVVVREQQFRLDNTDLVQIELNPDLASGARVEAGSTLARIRSPQHEQRLAQFQAEQAALAAQKDLLAAGGRPAEVRASVRRIEVAKARRAEMLAELERTRSLAAQGAISSAELESAELKDQVRGTQLALEQSLLDVTRSSARPEALAELDALIRAADARTAELESLLKADLVEAPFAGTVDLGSRSPDSAGEDIDVLKVYDSSTVWVRLPVPEDQRYRLAPDAPVRFAAQSLGGRVFEGSIAAVGNEADVFAGKVSFWAIARLDDAGDLLHPGTTGVVTVELQPTDRGRFASLRDQALGP